jgi:hypothetical protein
VSRLRASRRAACGEYILVVQAGFECIARQQVQRSKTLLVAFLGKFQDVTEINAALVANSMVGHQTTLKLLDEEWTRHPEDVGSPLCSPRFLRLFDSQVKRLTIEYRDLGIAVARISRQYSPPELAWPCIY